MPHSDLDFLVELEPRRNLLNHAALLLNFGTFSTVEVDVLTERGLRPRIREHAFKRSEASLRPLCGITASDCCISSRIERYSARGREAFEPEEFLQTWFVHHPQIIGEGARKLSEPFRPIHAEIPWFQIIAMRNILVYDYFDVDADEVWAAVERDVPRLKA